MHAPRHIAGWTLLVTLVAGGVLGPSLHRIQHAQDWQDAPSCHPAAVHNADGPLWTDAGGHVDTPECDLCATRLLVAPPSLDPVVAPHRGSSLLRATLSHLISAAVVAVPFIRGPPRQA